MLGMCVYSRDYGRGGGMRSREFDSPLFYSTKSASRYGRDTTQ